MNQESLLRKLFPEAMSNRDNGCCPFCGKEINIDNEFRDELSIKEYHISGLCQACQDKVFQ